MTLLSTVVGKMTTKELLSRLESRLVLVQREETSVKMMLALVGVAVSAAALAVLVIVELLARLLPVLVLAGLCWVAFTVWRRPHRPRPHQRAAPAQPAPSPS